MHRPRVILADDHVMVREGLALLLQPEVDLVASVSNGRELLEAAKRLQPDVIVTDLTMPELGGLEALRIHRQEGLTGKFVILTVHADAAIAAEAIRAGASGYVVKHAAGDELLQAVRLVMRGQSFLSPLVEGDVVRRLAQRDTSPGHRLTPRQREVLRLLADGRRVKEIASELGLSVRTVETHKYEIMHQLDVHSPMELVKFAIRHGIITA
jgi:DNA-binding NarL/FixJ family response regulator